MVIPARIRAALEIADKLETLVFQDEQYQPHVTKNHKFDVMSISEKNHITDNNGEEFSTVTVRSAGGTVIRMQIHGIPFAINMHWVCLNALISFYPVIDHSLGEEWNDEKKVVTFSGEDLQNMWWSEFNSRNN